jgi:hypothetical protein
MPMPRRDLEALFPVWSHCTDPPEAPAPISSATGARDPPLTATPKYYSTAVSMRSPFYMNVRCSFCLSMQKVQ